MRRATQIAKLAASCFSRPLYCPLGRAYNSLVLRASLTATLNTRGPVPVTWRNSRRPHRSSREQFHDPAGVVVMRPTLLLSLVLLPLLAGCGQKTDPKNPKDAVVVVDEGRDARK